MLQKAEFNRPSIKERRLTGVEFVEIDHIQIAHRRRIGAGSFAECGELQQVGGPQNCPTASRYLYEVDPAPRRISP